MSFWNAEPAPPFTVEQMVEVVRRDNERRLDRALEVARNAAECRRAIPDHLLDHPDVARFLVYVDAGVPMHPRLRDKVMALVDEAR